MKAVFRQSNAEKAKSSFLRRVKAEFPVSDKEWEGIARQEARLWGVTWEWSEDHYAIIFREKRA